MNTKYIGILLMAGKSTRMNGIVKKYYVSTSCNQIVLTNGNDEHILKVAIGYYTFNEFCDAIVGEVSKVVDVGGLTYKDEYVGINTMNTAPKTSNQIRNGLERQKQLYHTIPNIPLEPDIATDIIHFETFV